MPAGEVVFSKLLQKKGVLYNLEVLIFPVKGNQPYSAPGKQNPKSKVTRHQGEGSGETPTPSQRAFTNPP
jgi:hypothetical protein